MSDKYESADFYIVDMDRTRVSESVVFWREHERGYTVDVNDAGHYTLRDAACAIGDERSVIIPADAFDSSRFVTIAVKSQLKDALVRGITYDEARNLR